MTACPKCSSVQLEGEICLNCGLVFHKYRPPQTPEGPKKPYDWERFWLHFICGALAGVFIGGLIWVRYWHEGLSGWLIIGGASLLSAVMGGVFGDVWWAMMLQTLSAWSSRRW
jgi:hypothetical protein